MKARKIFRRITLVMFLLTIAYDLYWLGFSFVSIFTGIPADWLTGEGSHDMLYGLAAFVERLKMSILYTAVYMKSIPLYQFFYLIMLFILSKVSEKQERKRQYQNELKKMYVVQDENGNEIARCKDFLEAQKALDEREEADRENGTFTEDFYKIVRK